MTIFAIDISLNKTNTCFPWPEVVSYEINFSQYFDFIDNLVSNWWGHYRYIWRNTMINQQYLYSLLSNGIAFLPQRQFFLVYENNQKRVNICQNKEVTTVDGTCWRRVSASSYRHISYISSIYWRKYYYIIYCNITLRLLWNWYHF